MFRLILFVAAFAAYALGQCPPNSLSLETSSGIICYSFHSRLSKFAMAQTHCKSFGAQLVSLKNEHINVYVTHFAKVIFEDIVFFWSGGNKLQNPLEFQWSNGEKLEYDHFTKGQDRTNGSCISADVVQGHWKAENCFAELSFVCEFSPGKGITPTDAEEILNNGDDNGEEATTTPPRSTTDPFPTYMMPLLPTESVPDTPRPTLDPNFSCKGKFWIRFENYCYRFSKTKKSWHDAEADCQSEGAHLISLHNDNETYDVGVFQHLETTVARGCVYQQKRHFWIGLNKVSSDKFEWSDSSKTDYEKFLPNPEDIHYKALGNCLTAEINDDIIEGWKDSNCEEKLKYICKKELTLENSESLESRYSNDDNETVEYVPPCSEGWKYFRDHCYKVFDSTKSWSEAESTCKSEDSQLASIHDREENNLITELGQNISHGVDQCKWIRDNFKNQIWIGLSNQSDHFYSKWTDGTERAYTHWKPDEPNNLGGSESCMHIIIAKECDSHGFWNDLPCEKELKFVCKKKKAVEETPVNILPETECDAPPEKGPCPSGWSRFQNSCYKVFPKKDFLHARCGIYAAAHASIHSKEENAFIAELGYQALGGNNSCEGDNQMWHGFDGTNDAFYDWKDETAVDYTNWAPGKPEVFLARNLKYENKQRCAQIVIGKGCEKLTDDGKIVPYEHGKWNEYNCDKEMPYICKRDVIV